MLQEVLVWLTALQKEMGGEVSDEAMRDYIWNTLKSGRVSLLENKNSSNSVLPCHVSTVCSGKIVCNTRIEYHITEDFIK